MDTVNIATYVQVRTKNTRSSTDTRQKKNQTAYCIDEDTGIRSEALQWRIWFSLRPNSARVLIKLNCLYSFTYLVHKIKIKTFQN